MQAQNNIGTLYSVGMIILSLTGHSVSSITMIWPWWHHHHPPCLQAAGQKWPLAVPHTRTSKHHQYCPVSGPRLSSFSGSYWKLINTNIVSVHLINFGHIIVASTEARADWDVPFSKSYSPNVYETCFSASPGHQGPRHQCMMCVSQQVLLAKGLGIRVWDMFLSKSGSPMVLASVYDVFLSKSYLPRVLTSVYETCFSTSPADQKSRHQCMRRVSQQVLLTKGLGTSIMIHTCIICKHVNIYCVWST